MDGTENQKDTSHAGDSSGGKQETSGGVPKTFTRESVEAEKQKAISDALSAAGRNAKALEIREQAVREAEARVAEDAKRRDEAYEESIKEDTEKLREWKATKSLKGKEASLAQREADFERERAEHKDTIEAANKVNRSADAQRIATEQKVDVKALLDFGGDTPESMETLAKVLPKIVAEPMKTDSSKTLGGGASWEEVRAAYIKNPNNPAIFERYMGMRKERERNR